MNRALIRDGHDDPEEDGAPRPDIVAAGAVVLRRGTDGPGGRSGLEALLVHRPRLDDWSIPKGKLDEGEHPLVAAVREVAEETGVSAALGRRLDPARYRVGGTLHKLVHYWTATVADTTAREPDEEVDEVRWVPLPQAAALVTHRWDRRLLTDLAARADPADAVAGVPPLVLVRHGKASPRKGWAGDDRLRPLAAEGERQALSLVPLLETFAPRRVLSSPSTRCRQTMLPFTRSTGRPLEAAPALTEQEFRADPDAAHRLVQELLAGREQGGRPVVVCTHRPVLDAVLHRLTGQAHDPRRLAPAEIAVLTGPADDLRIDRYPAPG